MRYKASNIPTHDLNERRESTTINANYPGVLPLDCQSSHLGMRRVEKAALLHGELEEKISMDSL
jgi:hypothetical protein